MFQRREDGSVDFYRGWNDYKNGFGNITGEFWLGNQNLHNITKQRRYTLRVDLGDAGGHRRYANYDNFEIKSEEDEFKLILGSYTGNAGKFDVKLSKTSIFKLINVTFNMMIVEDHHSFGHVVKNCSKYR